jgi:uncharacterized protein
MAPTLSTDRGLSPAHRADLLGVARRAIEAGLEGSRLRVPVAEFPEPLRAIRATFVTLEMGGDLRGCIGTLDARRALVEDVAWNAYAAAFDDPRFPPLARDELIRIEVHLSVLSPPELMLVGSEHDLLARLRPGIDGLLLQEGGLRGTFLPSVWQQLPDPVEFLTHLKRKAGLPANYWSATLRVSRYTTESVP